MTFQPPKANKNKPQQQQVAFMQHKHIGPIPDPSTLEKYNQIQEGFAERIVIMAEKEQSHRHENDIRILVNQENQHKRNTNTFRIGQTLALIAVAGIIGLCVYCIVLGFATQAASIACTVTVGLASVFVVNKSVTNKQQP